MASGDPMSDPNEGVESFDAAQHYGEQPEPVTTPTWFAITDTVDRFPEVEGKHTPETIGRVLVIAGRIAAHSWGLSYIGREWADELERLRGRSGWRVEEMKNGAG